MLDGASFRTSFPRSSQFDGIKTRPELRSPSARPSALSPLLLLRRPAARRPRTSPSPTSASRPRSLTLARMATVAPFSSTAYAAVPSTPTRSRTHSTTVSMYSDKDSLSPPSTPPRRPSSFAALTSPRSSRRLPAIVVVGVLSVLAWTLVGRSGSSSHALLAPAGRLQYNARGKVAVDFEAHEVPEEWLCNPYKEPGKLVVDLDTPVRVSDRCSRGGGGLERRRLGEPS